MNKSYGPWTTAIDTGSTAQLSAFWKRRLKMLPHVGTSSRRFSWRSLLLLVLLAAAAVALPAVQVLRTSSAAADEGQTTDKQPAGKPAAGDQVIGDQVIGNQPTDKQAVDKQSTDNPFAGGPRTTEVMVEYLPQPSPNEKKILATLEQPTECDFTETPLADVMDYLSAKHDILVRADMKELKESGMTPEVPITYSINGVSLKSALRRILSEHDLTFVVRDEVLLITTDAAAGQRLVTRTYPVGDLVIVGPSDGNFKELVEAITTTVEPSSWSEDGGPASAKIVAPAKSIVISQTYGTHENILDLLRSLRAAKSKQPGSEKVEAVRR
jgi:hypothetical protein